MGKWWLNGIMNGIMNGIYPLVICYIAIEMALEIMSFPVLNSVLFFHSKRLPDGISHVPFQHWGLEESLCPMHWPVTDCVVIDSPLPCRAVCLISAFMRWDC